jgi:hypothetical protein
MKALVRFVLVGVFGVVLFATTASASPVVCSANLTVGGDTKLFQASVDPAVACAGPVIGNNVFPIDLTTLGFTWLAQDKDTDAAPVNGATEDLLSVIGVNGTSGIFTIDPTDSQCGLLDCNYFVFGLKFGHAIAYFDLGNISTTTTFNWSTNHNALSNGAVYARYEGFRINNVPEPATMLLMATGAAFGIRRRVTAAA